jgi:hypothetical protein
VLDQGYIDAKGRLRKPLLGKAMVFPDASEQRAAELGARLEAWLLQRTDLGAGEESWLRMIDHQSTCSGLAGESEARASRGASRPGFSDSRH